MLQAQCKQARKTCSETIAPGFTPQGSTRALEVWELPEVCEGGCRANFVGLTTDELL